MVLVNNVSVSNDIPSVDKDKDLKIRMFQLYSELVFLSRIFFKNGLEVIALKGPLLSKHLYGDVTLRQCRDLDVLVTVENLEKAQEVILKLGYSRTDSELVVKSSQQDELIRYSHHFSFWHPHKQILVELHWVPFAKGVISSSLNYNTIPSSAKGLFSLEEADEFIYLVIHGVKHLWRRKKWLNDIQQYLKIMPDTFKQDVLDRCQDNEIKSWVEDSFVLSDVLLGGKLAPQSKLRLIESVQKSMSLVDLDRASLRGMEKLKHLLIQYQLELTIAGFKFWKRRIIFAFAESQFYRIEWLPTSLRFIKYLVAPFYYIFQLKK